MRQSGGIREEEEAVSGNAMFRPPGRCGLVVSSASLQPSRLRWRCGGVETGNRGLARRWAMGFAAAGCAFQKQERQKDVLAGGMKRYSQSYVVRCQWGSTHSTDGRYSSTAVHSVRAASTKCCNHGTARYFAELWTHL